MVKCVVSGCPNRVSSVSRGSFSRPPKRFFNFPKDHARVKVWLAALRETDKQDTSEHHLICEDHFLPEDISISGVSSDAIPLMPPCLDGPMGVMESWGEEDQWAAGGGEESEDEGGGRIPFHTKPIGPPEQVPTASRATEDPKRLTKWRTASSASVRTREDVSLGVLTRRFLGLFLKTPDGSVDMRTAITSLQTRRRRLYDITNVLEGIKLLNKKSANVVQWVGHCPVSSFLEKDESQEEMDSLKVVEDTLDTLIKSCAQQLFDMTDNLQNAALAYVTHKDISQLQSFKEQTVITVKAPEETRLEVPAPKEDSIQVHLKGGKGPILITTCDVSEDQMLERKENSFLSLEDSRIRTTSLHQSPSTAQCQ